MVYEVFLQRVMVVGYEAFPQRVNGGGIVGLSPEGDGDGLGGLPPEGEGGGLRGLSPEGDWWWWATRSSPRFLFWLTNIIPFMCWKRKRFMEKEKYLKLKKIKNKNL